MGGEGSGLKTVSSISHELVDELEDLIFEIHNNDALLNSLPENLSENLIERLDKARRRSRDLWDDLQKKFDQQRKKNRREKR